MSISAARGNGTPPISMNSGVDPEGLQPNGGWTLDQLDGDLGRHRGDVSQGTGVFGVFGGLLLLDASEATYCVPLNRAASALGGIVSATVLSLLFGSSLPSGSELAGAGLLVISIGVLWLGFAHADRADALSRVAASAQPESLMVRPMHRSGGGASTWRP